MIKAGIVGITGYGGIELFRLLYGHPDVEIAVIKANSANGESLKSLYPHLSHFDNICEDISYEEIAKKCDVVFTATPHGGASAPYLPFIKKENKKLIDLSADFRLLNPSVYKEWYNEDHKGTEFLSEAVYGMPELHKEKIKKAWLIANPGCYTTASILGNAPLVKHNVIDVETLIIDAKSGVSGAGRKPKQNLHYPEMNEGFSAYGLTNHRHTPEIEQELSLLSGKNILINFTPHLVPMNRGILASSYSKLVKKIAEKEIYDIYKEFYKNAPFVRIAEDYLPNTKYTAGSNFIDIHIKVDERTGRVIIISTLDNLIKGASGQAVQNMNLMFGLNEKTGLDLISLYP